MEKIVYRDENYKPISKRDRCQQVVRNYFPIVVTSLYHNEGYFNKYKYGVSYLSSAQSLRSVFLSSFDERRFEK